MTTTWSTAAALLTCPVCEGPLHLDERTLRCARGHSHDLARQGHVNLLGRAAPHHADTPAMVDARARFLGQGRYRALTDALAVQTPASSRVVLEVGAGTAHHLAGVLEQHPNAIGIATDISSAAARRAARAHPRLVSVVADTWRRLPVRDEVVDVVLCVFAPRRADEFFRVLRPGGLVLVATPTPEHLGELRAELGLMGIHDGKDDQILAQFHAFEQVGHVEVRQQVALDAAAVNDLVAMGPNAFHAPPQMVRGTTVQVAVDVRVFRR